jgi:hypothetical protein
MFEPTEAARSALVKTPTIVAIKEEQERSFAEQLSNLSASHEITLLRSVYELGFADGVASVKSED